MDQLPTELIAMICGYLYYTENDLANLRQVSKAFAAIATPYLFDSATCIVHRQSHERLLEMSRHPEIRKQVSTLWYHNEYIDDKFKTFRSWEEGIDERDWTVLLELENEYDPDNLPSFEQRAMDVEMKSLDIQCLPRHARTPEELRTAYTRYNRMKSDTRRMLAKKEDLDMLKETCTNFSNLKVLCLNSGYCYADGSQIAKRLIIDPTFGHSATGGSKARNRPEAVRTLSVCLEACSAANRKLKILQAGSINWQFFMHDQNPWLDIVSCLENLTCLDLTISTGDEDRGRPNAEEPVGTEAPACRRFFRGHDTVRNWLRSLKHLQLLRISFDVMYGYWMHAPARLCDIFGDSTWPHLKELNLGKMDTSAQDLLSLLSRHPTLEALRFQDIELWNEESWMNVLPKIREIVHVKDFWVWGQLTARKGDGEVDDFLTDFGLSWVVESWTLDSMISDEGGDLREDLCHYMIEGGEFPLVPEKMRFTRDLPYEA